MIVWLIVLGIVVAFALVLLAISWRWPP